MSKSKTARPRKERRLTRHARHARMVWDDPRSAGSILREGLLGLWRARGGGLYGLGYVITFVVLEIRLAVTELASSEGVLEFLGNQFLEYLLRLGVGSFVNALLAFLWPFLLLERVGGWGLLVLPGAYLLFERWLRPVIEARFPELARSRETSDHSGT